MSKNQKLKVALLQGGPSKEGDVSRDTSASFAEAVTELGHELHIIEFDGTSFEQLRTLKPDVALIGLHGRYGEDGIVQGFCEFLKIPYTGSGVMASAVCMDKAFMKSVLIHNELPTADYHSLDMEGVDPANVNNPLGWPVVVKPSREGSSFGVTLLKEENEAEWLEALKLAKSYDTQVLIEELIDGKEVTVPVLDGRPLTSIEISPRDDFYNYENKYTEGKTDYFLPAKISDSLNEKCQEWAIRACEVIGVRGYGRVDFLVRGEDAYILEVNTLPGCTKTSLLPKSAKHEGIEFKEVIQTLIDTASLDYR